MISFGDCLSHKANLAHATKMRMHVVLEVIETLAATLSQARNLFLRDQRDEGELDGWFALLPELMRLLHHPPRQCSDYAAFRFGQKAILGTDDSSRASRCFPHHPRPLSSPSCRTRSSSSQPLPSPNPPCSATCQKQGKGKGKGKSSSRCNGSNGSCRRNREARNAPPEEVRTRGASEAVLGRVCDTSK